MNLLLLVVPLVCFGVGFIVSDFLRYFWTLEAIIEVHRLGFITIAIVATIFTSHYLLRNNKLAERMAKSKYDSRMDEIAEQEKKSDIRQFNLNDLYNKHRIYQNRIEQELHKKQEMTQKLRVKLSKVDILIEEIEKLIVTTSDNNNLNNRSNRQKKKIEKIIYKAEALRNGENCESI